MMEEKYVFYEDIGGEEKVEFLKKGGEFVS